MVNEFDSNSVQSYNAMEMLSTCIVPSHDDRSGYSKIFDIYKKNKINKEFKNEIIACIDNCLYLTSEVKEKVNETPAMMLWMWDNFLYPTYTLTFYIKQKKKIHQYRVFLKHDSEETKILLSQKVKLVFLRHKSILNVYDIDLSKVDKSFWDFLGNTVPSNSVGDFRASKWLIENCINRNLDPAKASWAKRLNESVGTLIHNYEDPKNFSIIQKERAELGSSDYKAIFNQTTNIFSSLYAHYLKAFLKIGKNPIDEFYKIRSELSETPYHQDILNRMIVATWFSSEFTSCGQKIISIDLGGGRCEFGVNKAKLGDCFRVFWERLPFRLPMYFSDLLGELNCPVEAEKFILGIPMYQGGIEQGQEFVENLLAEAVFMKKWTIPAGANVFLDVGVIKSARFFELGEDIACIVYDKSDNFMLIWINPYHREFSFIWHEKGPAK